MAVVVPDLCVSQQRSGMILSNRLRPRGGGCRLEGGAGSHIGQGNSWTVGHHSASDRRPPTNATSRQLTKLNLAPAPRPRYLAASAGTT
ncbi:hypothetical protein J6590_027718 [Homalodisca vitripennis]|nr:hypothetical protein J6590_027718 [Homalodisca vitripennis]